MFTFDDSEYEGASPDTETMTSASAVLDGLEQQQQEDVDTSKLMSEVEKRLEVASYYKLLLNDSLFANSTSAAARAVEREIRSFVIGRLEILVGVRSEAPRPEIKLPFSGDEIQALKALASKVIGKPALLTPVAKAEKIKPALKPVQVPAKVEPKRSAIKQVEAPAPEVKAQDAKVQKVGGKKYKTVVTSDGKEVRMDVTGQVRNPQMAAMPNNTQMTAISHSQAVQANALAAQSNPFVAGLASATVTSNQ